MFLCNRFVLSQDSQTKFSDENIPVSEGWEIIEKRETQYKQDLQKMFAGTEGKLLNGKELQALTKKSSEVYNQRILELTRCILHPNVSENDFLRAFARYFKVLTNTHTNAEIRKDGLCFLTKSMETFLFSKNILDESLLSG